MVVVDAVGDRRARREDLYDFRNAVIHRFIISGITYDQIGSRLDRYEAVLSRLRAQLEDIEQPAPALSDADVAAVHARIARKLGHPARDERPPHPIDAGTLGIDPADTGVMRAAASLDGVAADRWSDR